MTETTDRALTVASRHRIAGVVFAGVMLSSLGFTGCSVIKAAKKIEGTVRSNKAVMGAFTNKIKAGEGTTFEATYVTTGSSPETVVYAVQPPSGLAFSLTPSATSTTVSGSANNVDIIVNQSGEYLCTPPSAASGAGGSGSSKWKCEKAPKTSAADYNNILDFYTPAHWVKFLGDFAIGAGFAGDKVSSSTMTVNGFAMSCVDLVAPGVSGTSTICTTAQNILGYVKVAQDSTSFEITKYSASPSASLFQLPPGATVTTIPVTTTTVPPGTT
jgi:hypothetical protein